MTRGNIISELIEIPDGIGIEFNAKAGNSTLTPDLLRM